MKSFFKIVFASMVGFLLTFVVFFLLTLMIVSASSSKKEVELKKNSVLYKPVSTVAPAVIPLLQKYYNEVQEYLK